MSLSSFCTFIVSNNFAVYTFIFSHLQIIKLSYCHMLTLRFYCHIYRLYFALFDYMSQSRTLTPSIFVFSIFSPKLISQNQFKQFCAIIVRELISAGNLSRLIHSLFCNPSLKLFIVSGSAHFEFLILKHI